MNKTFYYTLLILSLIMPIKNITSSAVAQSWSWARGTDSTAIGYTIATDLRGDVWCAGTKDSGSMTVGGFPIPRSAVLNHQAFWIKYSSTGTVLWADGAVTGGTPGSSRVLSITTDRGGNMIVFGTFSSSLLTIGSFTLYNSGSLPGRLINKFFLAKISSSGAVLWAIADGINFADAAPVTAWGSFTHGSGVTTDSSGNIYITSSFGFDSTSIGGTTLVNASAGGWGEPDVFIAKYTSSGAFVWARSFGGTKDDGASGIAVTPAGDVYVSGFFNSPSLSIGSSTFYYPGPIRYASDVKSFIAKFSSAGTPLWAESIGDTNSNGSCTYITSIVSDKAGNIYTCGLFTDPTLRIGGATITRTYPATGSPAIPALFLAKYAPSNTVTMTKTIGSPVATGLHPKFSAVQGFSCAVSPCGTVWVSGSHNLPVNIDGHMLTTDSFGKTRPNPAFIAGYDVNTGAVISYASIALTSDIQNAIACDPSGNVFLCNGYCDSVFAGPDTLRGIRPYYTYFFTAKYGNRPVVTDTEHMHTDTSFCSPPGITLNAPPGYSFYYWDDGTTSNTRMVTSGGVYRVYCSSGCGVPVLLDSFIVKFVPTDSTYRHTDTTVCLAENTVFSLKAPEGHATYLWNSGSTASSLNITTSGTYFVDAISGCKLERDSFVVTILPKPTVYLSKDTIICPGNTITLLVHEPHGTKFLWSNGSTDSFIYVSEAGTYTLDVDLNGCKTTAAINISQYEAVPIFLGVDTSMCDGNVVFLDAKNTLAYWSTNETGSSIYAALPGIYWVSVNGPCGIISDTIKIDFHRCEIVFPSAFTPNMDGLNDLIGVLGDLQYFSDFSLGIYNRFGQRVFYTEDIYKGWNGVFNGTKQDLGTFFYVIYYTLEGKKHMMKGDFNLIR